MSRRFCIAAALWGCAAVADAARPGEFNVARSHLITSSEAKRIALEECVSLGIKKTEFTEIEVGRHPVTLDSFLEEYPSPAFAKSDRLRGTLHNKLFWVVILSRALVEDLGGDAGLVVNAGGEMWVFVDARTGKPLYSFAMK